MKPKIEVPQIKDWEKIKEIIKNIMRYRKQISIEVICVDEKYRRKGIGTALLEYARKIGKENNCTDFYI